MQHNVAIGYLSILLVVLCLDGQACSIIRQSLDGNGLTQVLSTVTEFLEYHRTVDNDGVLLLEARHGSSGFIGRLERIANTISLRV